MTWSAAKTKRERLDAEAKNLCDLAWDTGNMLEKLIRAQPRIPQYVKSSIVKMAEALEYAAIAYEQAEEVLECETKGAVLSSASTVTVCQPTAGSQPSRVTPAQLMALPPVSTTA